MTQEGWRHAVLEAGRRHDAGDDQLLETMSELLTVQDAAKERLRRIGFGCIGMPWPDVIEEVAQHMRLTGLLEISPRD